MADNKNSATTLVCETQEALYKKAIKKMNADKLIVQHAFKIENYEISAVMFDEVGDYLDAPQLARQCRSLAKQTREEQTASEYDKALERMNDAATDDDYQKAAEQFRELGGYKEAEKKLRECEEKVTEYHKRSKHKRITVGVVLIAIILLLIAGGFSGFYRYLLGVCYSSMEYYSKAEPVFEELGAFLDSEERAQDCRDAILIQQKTEGEEQLEKAKTGDTVGFGLYQWKVLERNGEKLLLMVSDIPGASPLYQVPYHTSEEAASWEETSLREWLNSEFLESAFSEEEQAMMTANARSEDGTKDLVSILTGDEMENYQEITETLTGRDYWLKTLDTSEGRALFVSAAGTTMEYGYPVTAELSVRPVICVDCSKLAEEALS